MMFFQSAKLLRVRPYIGHSLLNIDGEQFTGADEWIRKAIESDKQNGMMWHLGTDYAKYLELFKRNGDL